MPQKSLIENRAFRPFIQHHLQSINQAGRGRARLGPNGLRNNQASSSALAQNAVALAIQLVFVGFVLIVGYKPKYRLTLRTDLIRHKANAPYELVVCLPDPASPRCMCARLLKPVKGRSERELKNCKVVIDNRP
jgi:hypothetical protein